MLRVLRTSPLHNLLKPIVTIPVKCRPLQTCTVLSIQTRAVGLLQISQVGMLQTSPLRLPACSPQLLLQTCPMSLLQTSSKRQIQTSKSRYLQTSPVRLLVKRKPLPKNKILAAIQQSNWNPQNQTTSYGKFNAVQRLVFFLLLANMVTLWLVRVWAGEEEIAEDESVLAWLYNKTVEDVGPQKDNREEK